MMMMMKGILQYVFVTTFGDKATMWNNILMMLRYIPYSHAYRLMGL